MTKKESTKRGYMTKNEVQEHLKSIGTTNARITYLNDILRKESLLSGGTRKAVYENLAELYEKRKDFDSAAKIYNKIGKREKWAGALQHSPRNWRSAAAYYDESGDLRKAVRVSLDATKSRQPQVIGFWREIYWHKKPGEKYEKLQKVAEILEDFGEDDIAAKIYTLDLKNREKSEELKRKIRKKSLYSKLSSIITIVGLGGGLFFLSSNITGNVIANLSTNTNSWIGGVLLAVGLIAGFFWIKNKKKR
jgi:tetratricopeptide (TPR) repeat protein